MYLGISGDVSRAKTYNSLKFPRNLPRLSAQMSLVLSKSGESQTGHYTWLCTKEYGLVSLPSQLVNYYWTISGLSYLYLIDEQR